MNRSHTFFLHDIWLRLEVWIKTGVPQDAAKMSCEQEDSTFMLVSVTYKALGAK